MTRAAHRRNRPCLLVWLLAAWVLAPNGGRATAGGSPCLAIVSAPQQRAGAELLTVVLSRQGVTLLERDAIDRVLQEQSLQLGALTREQAMRVGRLLKADGLILLSGEGGKGVTVRLVAVAPGVVLWYAEFLAPAPAAARDAPWPELVAATLGTYLPKLGVKPGAAVPVSLLRIRPAFDTPRLGQLAGDLNRLLLLRLLREPALFVLEREKLQSARVEADLTGGATDFWSGSYVVEGVVRYDLVQTNQVAFGLSVRAPGTSGPTEWVEAGGASELAQLVERAVGRLCRTIGTVADAAPWDIAAEAAKLTALAGGLVEPQERADALGTAMALGRQDVKTAAAYRNALRAVAFRDAERFGGLRLSLAPPPGLGNQAHAFLDLLRFHNAYRPPDDSAPAESKSWLHGVSPADAALFLEKTVAAGRAGELGELCGEIQVECRHMAMRLRDCDPNLEDYRRRQVCVRGARYFHGSTREILAVYRDWAFTPQTDPRHRVPRGIGEPWYLDRPMADPVFPAGDAEPAAERDRLWQAFIEEVAKSDRPELRINLAVLRLAQADRGEAQVKARRALQETLVDNAACLRPARYSTDFSYLWSVAFPPFRVRDGKSETAVLFRRNPLLEINSADYESPFDFLYPRYALVGRNTGAFASARVEDIQADARNAVRLLLAVTPEGQLRETDVEPLARRYASFLTEEEARSIFRLTREFVPECPTCTSPKPVDVFEVQEWLVARFPALRDTAHQTEARERRQAEALPSNALAVTRELRLPPGGGTDQPTFCNRRWFGDRFWACWGDDLIVFDPASKTCDLIPVPERINRKMFCHVSGIEASGTHILCWGSKHETSTQFGLRGRNGGEWRFVEFPFEVRAAAQIASTIYMLTVVPRVSMAAATGLVAVDAQTLECRTLRAPGTPLTKVVPRDGAIPFESLPFEYDLQVRDGLLLESSGGRIRYGWNPETNEVRPVKAAGARGYTEWDISPHLKASQPFGFTISSVNGLIVVCENNRFSLRVVRQGRGAAEAVPLRFANQPSLEKTDTRTKTAYFRNPIGYETDAILTPTSLFVPFFQDRGFWEIPYDDVRQWLARNPAAPETAKEP